MPTNTSFSMQKGEDKAQDEQEATIKEFEKEGVIV